MKTNINEQFTLIRKIQYHIIEFIINIFRKEASYKLNDLVYVSFKIGTTEPVIVKCRISEVFQCYHTTLYWVIAQESKDGIWYGMRERAFDNQIVKKYNKEF